MAETKAGVVFLAVTSCLRATKAADVKLGSRIGRWRGVANNKNDNKQTIIMSCFSNLEKDTQEGGGIERGRK